MLQNASGGTYASNRLNRPRATGQTCLGCVLLGILPPDFMTKKVGLGQVATPPAGSANHENLTSSLSLLESAAINESETNPGPTRPKASQSGIVLRNALIQSLAEPAPPSQDTRSGKRRFWTGASLRSECGRGKQPIKRARDDDDDDDDGRDETTHANHDEALQVERFDG